jgi:hypothetical protein
MFEPVMFVVLRCCGFFFELKLAAVEEAASDKAGVSVAFGSSSR